MYRRLIVSLLLCGVGLPAQALLAAGQVSPVPAAAGNATAGFEVPAWLFPINPSPTSPATAIAPAGSAELLHVPGSRAAFSRAQVTDLFAPPDWHPDEHPPMPDVVAHGRRPSVFACGYCHLPDGRGRPENAAIAGLPAAYIVQQVRAIASHARRSAWNGAAEYRPAIVMTQVAEQASDAEITEAAAYFSALGLRRRRAEVIETEQVPKTHVAGWIYVPNDGADDEPLGTRIIEITRELERHELRDPYTEYVAWVPAGSIARGRELATTGGGGVTLPCVSCHGVELRGAGLIPPIAGRSPSYLLRQLVAFKTGARATLAGQPMQPVVARLEPKDMIAVAAYAASRAP